MALVEDETSRVQEDVVSLSNPLLALAPDDLLLRMSKALRSLSSPLHPPHPEEIYLKSVMIFSAALQIE